MNKLAFLLYSFILIVSKYFSQSIPYIQYNSSNGLTTSTVYKIIQVKDSTYYICTNDGFIKFNGTNFSKEKVKNINYNQSITQAHLLNDTSMLFTSFREGLFFYDLKNKNAKKFTFNNNQILSADYSDGHKKMASCGNQIFLYKYFLKDNNTIQSNVLQYNLQNNTYSIIKNVTDLKAHNNEVYLISNESIFKYSTNSAKAYLYFKHPTLKDAKVFFFYNNDLHCVVGENIYVVSNNNIIFKLKISGLENKVVQEIEADAYGNFWIITNDYHFYKYKNNQLLELEKGIYKFPYLFIDHNQNLLLPSYTDGLNIYYNTFITNYGVSDGVINKNINQISKYNNKIYICTNNGYYTLKNDTLKHYTFNSFDLPYIYDAVKHNNQVVICSNRKPDVQNKNSGDIIFTQRNFYVLNNNQTLSSGWNNIIEVNKKFNEIELNLNNKTITLPDNLSKNNFVIGYKQINDSEVYVNTNTGLFIANINTLKNKRVKLITDRVNHISYNPKLNLYVFSTNKGLYIKNKNNWDSVFVIGNENLNRVNSCVFDLNNRLWIASANGIYITDLKKTTKLNANMGLLSNEVSTLFLDSSSNKMYVGTNNGFSVIDINQYNKQIYDIKVLINAIITNGDTIRNFKSFTFSPNQNSLEILFCNNFYPNKKALKIKYNLDGIETETTYLQSIKFTSLEYGSHVFKIKGSIDGLNWSDEEVYNFIINRPFYKSARFYLLALIAIVVLIVLISAKIIRKNKYDSALKMSLQSENNRLKFQALNSSINPHFVFNALYSIQSYVYNNQGNIASDYLAKLSRLIRITLEQADNIYISLDKELEKLTFYIHLEKLRFEEKLTISIENYIITNPSLINIPNMLIQPLIENAIIHGLNNKPNNGVIKVVFSETNTQVKITIEDNGVGINRSKKMVNSNHKSIGLSNVKSRIALIQNASIEIIDKADVSDNCGTIIIVLFPKVLTT